MALMRASLRSPLWVWAKVGVCLLVLDVLLFRWAMLFRLMPTLPQADPTTWGLLYTASRTLEAPPSTTPEAFLVGSSVLYLGVKAPAVETELQAHGIATRVHTFSTFGSTATDSALMAWQSLRRRPWLVVYAAASRDFNREWGLDTPVSRLFDDASEDVPPLRPTTVDGWLDRWVKRSWKLYRYRYFVRRALVAAGSGVLAVPAPPSAAAPSDAAQMPTPTAPPSADGRALPPEAKTRFLAMRITPESYAAWEHWRETRRFEDYADWMRASRSRALDQYATETLARYGPEGNPQAASLDWMLRRLQEAHVRALVVFFPENPAFRAPGGERYFDPALSDANAAMFAREAATHGARFVDLRGALDAEDFYDMIHPNLVGTQKLTTRMAELVAEEWRATSARPEP